MRASDVRKTFLDFFAGHGHEIVPSSSLLPENDPTLYFVNAGMVQFKNVFTGKETRAIPRATSSQKCLRVSGKHNDLDMVGRTPRHHTFFEMLGNFSFGDYFKEDAITMAWDLLTGELALDPERLWITVFHEDDEAWELWHRKVGIPEGRIQRLGAKDNFWSMGPVGPCGPCSEIHYDHGPGFGPAGGPATESDRYVELWNLVFMQYEQFEDGHREDLPRPSIDTGSGLERVAAAKQGVYSNYETDLFQGLIARAADIAGLRYGASVPADTALQVIADHARATAMLVSDGVIPSNTEEGYILRRIMRRAIRFGVKLDLERPFFHEITRKVVEDMGGVFPSLQEHAAFIDEVVQSEEERFRLTLGRGTRLLDAELEGMAAGDQLSGDVAFTLKDTYGFPLDLTQIITGEREITVDVERFQELEAVQKASSGADTAVHADEETVWDRLAATHGRTVFTGYDAHTGTGRVLAILRDDAPASALATGEAGVVLLDRTPFYGEAGGQLGDGGLVTAGGVAATVTHTTKTAGLHLHHLEVTAGSLAVGDEVQLAVDRNRVDTQRNHTATHILHAALRQVLGSHVAQKGSLVGPDRLRFDFSHHKAVSDAELREVEALANAQVLLDADVTTELRDLDEARAAGAMALFGEKYDEKVRVVSISDFSMELCGGTHVGRTGEIGLIRVTGEGSVSAGVRRLEAVTGPGALAWSQGVADTLSAAASRLKTSPDQLVAAIERLQEDKRQLERELAELQREVARAAAGDLVQGAREFGGVKVLASEFDGDLREQADRLRDQLGSSLVVLMSGGAKVKLLVATTKDLAGSRIHAGKLVKDLAPLVGGGGGGRPDMAQAGGRDASGIPAVIERVYAWAAENLG